MTKCIYTITAINDQWKTRRIFGYYFTCKKAFDTVNKIYGQMHECLYQYLVIEQVPEGILSEAIAIQWYKWGERANKWETCERPEFANGIVNWGIG